MNYNSYGEPSEEERQELALLYIQRMRSKNIEPAVGNLVKRYLISEELARELLSQKTPQAQSEPDVYPRMEINDN
jgi:hypothetical protein